MKKLIILSLLICNAICDAQIQKGSIGSLLLQLIPSTGKPASWLSAVTASDKTVKWSAKTPTKQIIGYSVGGDSKIDFNKQRITCDGKPCVASIGLNGQGSKAYDEIEITIQPDDLPTIQIEKLFGKIGYTSKVIKNEMGALGGVMYYEVKFPQKSTVWIQIMTIPAYREGNLNDFSVTVFLNKQAMQKRMN